jgi:hypothetical protein
VTSRGDGGGSRAGPARDRTQGRDASEGRDTGGRGRCYSKIKSYLTCGVSQRRGRARREVRPFRGTSWFPVYKPHARGRSALRQTTARRVVLLPVVGVIRCRHSWSWSARESLRKRSARAVPDRRRTPDARGMSWGRGDRSWSCSTNSNAGRRDRAGLWLRRWPVRDGLSGSPTGRDFRSRWAFLEVEAKYAVADPAVFDALLELRALGGYAPFHRRWEVRARRPTRRARDGPAYLPDAGIQLRGNRSFDVGTDPVYSPTRDVTSG